MSNLFFGEYILTLITPFRLTIGITLVLAGIEKVNHLPSFVAGILQYQVLPIRLARWYGRLLPIIEIGTGALLLLGNWIRPAAIVSATLFVSFSIAVGLNLARKRKIPCFCFGSDSSNIGWHTVIRILFLLLISLFIIIIPNTQDVLLGYIITPSLTGLTNLIPAILLTAFGIIILSVIDISPLVVSAWTAKAVRIAHQRDTLVWSRERNEEVRQKL
jgi:uncharacterized membrane protein YphA (DoxX/SURF4 family)